MALDQQALKDLRVEIDKNIKGVAEVKTALAGGAGAREIALVYTKLQEAKMWVGKVMEAQGSELPAEYRDEYKPE